MIYDYLVVGAGLAGSVLAERIASVIGKRVLVIDKREHIAGNCFDFVDENGILVHKYGPHIFHTNNQKVWDYLTQFTEWHFYEHRVLAVIGDKKVPVPFNLSSIEILFDNEKAERLKQLLIDTYGEEVKIPILKLKETDNPELKELADFIYNFIFLGYTSKQWGLKPEELDFSVTSRIPVFISRDDRYFQDKYQAIPKAGYTKMIENILNHPNIDIRLNTKYEDVKNLAERIIYTGPIDEFFDYKHGKLPYRSLEFEFCRLNQSRFQERAQVNYPNDHDYTRITEFSHFLSDFKDKTTIAYEYPKEYIQGINDPYYPIPSEKSSEIYEKYKQDMIHLDGKVFFVGRLAEYVYYNMDQVVGVALMMFDKKIDKNFSI